MQFRWTHFRLPRFAGSPTPPFLLLHSIFCKSILCLRKCFSKTILILESSVPMRQCCVYTQERFSDTLQCFQQHFMLVCGTYYRGSDGTGLFSLGKRCFYKVIFLLSYLKSTSGTIVMEHSLVCVPCCYLLGNGCTVRSTHSYLLTID